MSGMIPSFFTPDPQWREQIDAIVELVGRIGAFEQLSSRAVELRRRNRVLAVSSSTAIEGNTLSFAQVEAIANGERVFAAPREVLENQNALAAYAALDDLDPWSVPDLLRAHAILTGGLVAESGAFRTVEVDIVNPIGEVLHSGSRSAKVPRLVAELLEWGKTSHDHPLIVSSSVHYLLEHIHPFRDGNGRIGRLWQTLILSTWRPLFTGVPIESMIHEHQAGYYQALQASHDPDVDAAPFIDYMLTIITRTLGEYERQVQPGPHTDDANGEANDDLNHRLLTVLREHPQWSAERISAHLGVSPRTVQRHRNLLRDAGRIRHIGPAKTGYWEVLDQ